MADLQKIVDDLSGLTVLEAAELAKLLEEKWGVSAAAAVAVAAKVMSKGRRLSRRRRVSVAAQMTHGATAATSASGSETMHTPASAPTAMDDPLMRF